ncbi:MAG: alpha/beta hydrolase, partial [SAR324 cluster bacterium]|nr:alpha/beta hydrolase [SAR324 cluster bacterium]
LHGKRGAALLEAWSSHWLSPVHAKWSIEKYLGYIECPLLVVQGDRDEFGSEAQVTAIVNRVGGAETWIVEGCGHTPHNEAPEAFLERVTQFLRQNAERAG